MRVFPRGIPADVGRVLRRALRGRSFSLGARTEAFCLVTLAHRIQPLLFYRTRRSGTLGCFPDFVRELLLRAFHAEVATEALRRAELTRILSTLAEEGVDPVVVKGTALAYTHYELPALRPRLDTDLFVDERWKATVRRVFSELGYEEARNSGGDLLFRQALFVRRESSGFGHAFDVHWALSNVQDFATVLSFGEVFDGASLLPELGMKVPSSVHSLLLACFHRVAHHREDERLVWLADLDLLARSLQPHDWEKFLSLAGERRILTVCRESLLMARWWFGTPVPNAVLRVLRLPDRRRERSSLYLNWQSQLPRALLEVGSFPGWRMRLRYVRQHLFPPAEFVTKGQRRRVRFSLPLLYLQRAARGVWKGVQAREKHFP